MLECKHIIRLIFFSVLESIIRHNTSNIVLNVMQHCVPIHSLIADNKQFKERISYYLRLSIV